MHGAGLGPPAPATCISITSVIVRQFLIDDSCVLRLILLLRRGEPGQMGLNETATNAERHWCSPVTCAAPHSRIDIMCLLMRFVHWLPLRFAAFCRPFGISLA